MPLEEQGASIARGRDTEWCEGESLFVQKTQAMESGGMKYACGITYESNRNKPAAGPRETHAPLSTS